MRYTQTSEKESFEESPHHILEKTGRLKQQQRRNASYFVADYLAHQFNRQGVGGAMHHCSIK